MIKSTVEKSQGKETGSVFVCVSIVLTTVREWTLVIWEKDSRQRQEQGGHEAGEA